MLIEIQRDPFDERITVAIWRNRNHPRRSIAFDMIDYPDNDRIRVTQIDNSRPPGDPGRVDSYFISFDELKAKLFPPATPPNATPRFRTNGSDVHDGREYFFSCVSDPQAEIVCQLLNKLTGGGKTHE